MSMHETQEGWKRDGNFFVPTIFDFPKPHYYRVVLFRNSTVRTAIRELKISAEMNATSSIQVKITPATLTIGRRIIADCNALGKLYCAKKQIQGGFSLVLENSKGMFSLIKILNQYSNEYEKRNLPTEIEEDLKAINQFIFDDYNHRRYQHITPAENESCKDMDEAKKLIQTVRAGNLTLFTKLLKLGYNIKAIDKHGFSIIFYIVLILDCRLAIEFLKVAAPYGANIFAPCGTSIFFHTPLELALLNQKFDIINFYHTLMQCPPPKNINPSLMHLNSISLKDHTTHLITSFGFKNGDVLNLITKRDVAEEERAKMFELFKNHFTSPKGTDALKRVFDLDTSGRRTFELLYHADKLIGFFVYDMLFVPEVKNTIVINAIYGLIEDPKFAGCGLAFIITFRFLCERLKSHPEYDWWMVLIASSKLGYLVTKKFFPRFPLHDSERARAIMHAILKQIYLEDEYLLDGSGDVPKLFELDPILPIEKQTNDQTIDLDLLFLDEHLLNHGDVPIEHAKLCVLTLLLACREIFEVYIENAKNKGLNMIKHLEQFSRYADKYTTFPLGVGVEPNNFSGIMTFFGKDKFYESLIAHESEPTIHRTNL